MNREEDELKNAQSELPSGAAAHRNEAGEQVRELRMIIALLSVLALFAVGAVLYLLQSVLLPFVIAVFLSFLFKPVVEQLRKRRIPTAVALLAVVLVVAAVLTGVSMVAVSSVNSFIAALPRYEARLTALASELLGAVQGTASGLGWSLDEFSISDAIPISSVTSMVSASLGSLLSALGDGVMILLFMIFILAGAGDLSRKIVFAFSGEHAESAASVIENIDDRVRRYMLTKAVVSLFTGTVTTVILLILGVDFALLWGFLAFLLNFIPNIGSIISTFFPVLIALLQFDSPARALIALVLIGAAQNLIGNVLEPKIMAFSLDLSPLLILASLIFWGWLWGIWGMILAVPIMSMLKIVFEQVDGLKPVAVLMSGSLPRGKG